MTETIEKHHSKQPKRRLRASPSVSSSKRQRHAPEDEEENIVPAKLATKTAPEPKKRSRSTSPKRRHISVTPVRSPEQLKKAPKNKQSKVQKEATTKKDESRATVKPGRGRPTPLMRRLKSLAHVAPPRYWGTPSLPPKSRTEMTQKPANQKQVEQKPVEQNPVQDSRAESEAETLEDTDRTTDDEDKRSSQASEAGFEEDSGDGDGKLGSEDDELEDDFDNLYQVTDFVDDLAAITSDDGSFEEEEEDDDDDEDLPEDFYNVECILDRRGRGTYKEYLVKWEGFSSDENSWVPMDDFVDPQMIKDYEKHRKQTLEKKPLYGFFVVEAILSHRDDRGSREYLVKWEGYPASENSWVEEEDFKNKEIVDQYKKHIDGDDTDE